MMKRVLFGLALLACGLGAARADPYRGDGRAYARGGERGGPPAGLRGPDGPELGEPGMRGPGMRGPGMRGPGPGAPYGGRPFGGRRFGGPYAGGPGFEGRPDMPPPIDERPRRHADQDRARAQMRAGEIRPLRDIQQQWRQGMPGYDFLGSDYDPGAGSYRLKFLRDGSVIWIDVDGRTGREIGRRGR